MRSVPFKKEDPNVVVTVGIESMIQCGGSPAKFTIMHTGKINLAIPECKGSQVLRYQNQYCQSKHETNQKSPYAFIIYDDELVPLVSFESIITATIMMGKLPQGLSIIISALTPLISQMIADLEKKLTEELIKLRDMGIKELSSPLHLTLSFKDGTIGLVCDKETESALQDYFNGLPPSQQPS